jgi:hypothetical protein
VKKQLKTYIALILLAILAIGLMFFSQRSSSTSLLTATAQTTTLEKGAQLHVTLELPAKPLSLQVSTDHYPLQAVKVEEVTVNVTQRVRPVYNLFSIALLLFGFESTSSEKQAVYFPVKALHFSAPFYILFRQIII